MQVANILIALFFTYDIKQPVTACKQYCLAAGATQGNIAYTRAVIHNANKAGSATP
jgi:hypothetical protein